MWRVIDIDYIHYEYKYEDTGTGPVLQARHDHDAAMLRALLLFLLSVGLLGLGTLQQADDLGVVEYFGKHQRSGPIIHSSMTSAPLSSRTFTTST
mgnify:CR=1 FL=1